MRFISQLKTVAGLAFVVTSFQRQEGEEVLRDGVLKEELERLKLRPVTQEEFMAYTKDPDTVEGKDEESYLFAFGNTVQNPKTEAHFAGIPYLNSGELEVAENWTRGNTGDHLGDGSLFLFISTEPEMFTPKEVAFREMETPYLILALTQEDDWAIQSNGETGTATWEGENSPVIPEGYGISNEMIDGRPVILSAA